jgi:hypothetical protein
MLRLNRGGRPTHTHIEILEGSVEAIIVIKDDAELFERGSRQMHVCASHLEFEMNAEAINLGHVRRISATMNKLSDAMLSRCVRLREAVLPEQQRINALAEAHFDGAVA